MDKMVLFAIEFLQIHKEIEIDFTDDFEGSCGWCTYDDGEIVIGINSKLSKEQICRTLFHELVHAKQYIEGELVSGIGLKPSRWFGVPYKGENYWDLPWEKEAYETEDIMWDIFSNR